MVEQVPSDPTHPAGSAGVASPGAWLRIGAVARLLDMPVATLRVWERRYALTRTAWSAGGQRLYAAADVQRLALIKRLSDQGHAIGQLAPLDLDQLQGLAEVAAQVSLQAGAASSTPASSAPVASGAQAGSDGPSDAPWRLAIVGPAIADRLRRPATLRRLRAALGRPVELLGSFDSLEAAQVFSAAPAADRHAAPEPIYPDADAWLIHQPQLQADALPQLPSAAVALLYRYASEAVCEALDARGVALLREPQPDVALAQWLAAWGATRAATADLAQRRGAGRRGRWSTGAFEEDRDRDPAEAADDIDPDHAPIPPRRWDDATLTDLTARASGGASAVACECPRHVAELLLQLAQFEQYSAQCRDRNPADAELHAALVRTAGRARAGFEEALQRVALHEGWPWPPG